MYSVRGKAMFAYLSWYYGNSRIMQSVQDSQGIEIDDARTALEEILKQFYADTADWAIERWEKELAVTPPENADIALRRALVKAKLLRPAIMTPAQIQAIVNQFVLGQTAKIIEIPQTYTFRIDIPLGDLLWGVEMRQALEAAKPAHLGYAIRYTVFSGLDDVAAMDEDFTAQMALLLKDYYPWPGLRLDGSWSLHDVSKLDGTWPLDAARHLDHRLPVPPGVRLNSKADVLGPLLIRTSSFHEKPEAKRLLDGRWTLDGQHVLGDNPAPIDASGDLVIRRYRRLDGKWNLDGGDKNLLNGSFPLDGRAGLDGGGIRLGITQYADSIDGKLRLQRVEKFSPAADRHPVFQEEMNVTDQGMVLHRKVSFTEEATGKPALNGEYLLNGAIALGDNLLPHEFDGALQIIHAKRLDGTWPLDGGVTVRLDGTWILNGDKLLYGGGTRLEIARRIEKL
ncbi:putative phage tail protein [Propionispora vibrioides]|uniref:DUF2313 domain-containing protein n=1 Tax=Propionispora vibrioides TaxID=112903 RepID=A0A1H8U7F9_9FIRM|nr:putative phage tail protein [Propionispora vibrioides]SEO98764.1 hypothetical protein SAMN04490178_10851 [Propionispora vibrioides]